MAYVPVPKDLTRVKTKFLFNLTKRQVFCFGLGALAGVPLFFLTKNVLGASMATLLMIAVMLPFSCSPCSSGMGSRWRSCSGSTCRHAMCGPAPGSTRPTTSTQPSTRISAFGGR